MKKEIFLILILTLTLTIFAQTAIAKNICPEDNCRKKDNLFVSVGYKGTFSIIDARKGKTKTVEGLPYSLQAISTSPEGITYIANYFGHQGQGRGIHILNPKTGETEYIQPSGASYPIISMAFSPDGKLYVAEKIGSSIGYFGVINLTEKSYQRISNLIPITHGMEFSQNRILYGTVNGKLYTINTTNGKRTLASNNQFLQSSYSLAFTPDGRLYAIGREFNSPDRNSTMIQINPETAERIGEPIKLTRDMRGLAFFKDTPKD